MNSEFLLSALSRFGDHPDRIQEFRKVIVGLAISGRLDGQNEQKPPSELIEAIEAHKADLFARREIAKPKRYSAITDEQLPSQFVDASVFVALGSIARIEKGLTGIQQAQPGPYPLVVTAAERSTCDHFDFAGPAAIIPLVSSTGHGHASINRLHYQEGEFALGTILAAVVPFAPELISARFLFEYLSTFKDELLVTRMTGTANVTLSIGRIAEVPVPLVSPAAQRKVDELMVLCDQLEAARAEREGQRDMLTVSTLAKLNEPDPETFATDARFALEHLEPLTKRTDQIKQIRQTILNLAVRGRLVDQDVVQRTPTRIGDPTEVLPETWSYLRLEDLLLEDTRNGYSRRPDDAPDGVPILRISAGTVRSDGIVAEEEHKLISGIDQRTRQQYGLCKGDLLACRFNGNKAFVGRMTLFADYIGNGPIYPDKLIRVRCDQGIACPEFVRLASESDLVRNEIEGYCATTVGNWGISAGKLKQVRFPVPPLAEQHRIVAKVDELMALCDQLEASLTESEQTRSKLLEAVLHEALEAA